VVTDCEGRDEQGHRPLTEAEVEPAIPAVTSVGASRTPHGSVSSTSWWTGRSRGVGGTGTCSWPSGIGDRWPAERGPQIEAAGSRQHEGRTGTHHRQRCGRSLRPLTGRDHGGVRRAQYPVAVRDPGFCEAEEEVRSLLYAIHKAGLRRASGTLAA